MSNHSNLQENLIEPNSNHSDYLTKTNEANSNISNPQNEKESTAIFRKNLYGKEKNYIPEEIIETRNVIMSIEVIERLAKLSKCFNTRCKGKGKLEDKKIIGWCMNFKVKCNDCMKILFTHEESCERVLINENIEQENIP